VSVNSGERTSISEPNEPICSAQVFDNADQAGFLRPARVAILSKMPTFNNN
jgi:hypothetical protein